MSPARQTLRDPRVDAVLTDLKAKISQRYAAVTFDVYEGEDPDGTYLRATVDVEDTDDVTDLIIDQLLDVQVEDRLPLYFIAARPAERNPDGMKSRKDRRPDVESIAMQPQVIR